MKLFKKIGVKSFAKFNFYYLGLMGLFLGIIAGLPLLLFGTSPGEYGDALGRFWGLGLLIGLPLFYGLMGLIFGFLGGYLINFILKLSGGLEVEFTELEQKEAGNT